MGPDEMSDEEFARIKPVRQVAISKEYDTSFEYMRRKLWCDVLFQAIGMSNERGVALADEVIELFDQRFGKGEGE